MARLRRRTLARVIGLVATFVQPGMALAQDGQVDVAATGDTAWLLAATVLAVVTVLPGLALLHAGRARAGAGVSIAVQVASIAALASILWIVVGYTLAFGQVTSGYLGGGNAWMLIELGNVREGTGVPESAFAMFQMTFAILAPALIAGAWVGRARFGWVIAFSALWSLVVYAPIAHWLWGGGWLAASVGTVDWAGGLVVHTAAGVSSLVVAMLLGPRRDRTTGALAPQSSILALAGAALMWVGMLAQAGGYALAASDDASAALIALQGAVAASVMTWVLMDRIGDKLPTALGLANAVAAGLATIAGAAGYVSPGGAIVIGVLGAIACRSALPLVRDRMGIDDSLGVFAVHGVGGIVGALLVGPFMSEAVGGVGYGPTGNAIAQSVAQAIGVGVVVLWSAVGTLILAVMASLVVSMRVSQDDELAGLDAALHGEPASK